MADVCYQETGRYLYICLFSLMQHQTTSVSRHHPIICAFWSVCVCHSAFIILLMPISFCWKSFQARMQNDFKCKCLAQMKHFRMTAGSFVVAKTGRRDTSTSRQDTAEPCPGLRPLSSVCLTNVYCIEVSVSA